MPIAPNTPLTRAGQCYNRGVMDFRILGPLEVRDRGGSVEIRRRKPRALLAALLLRAGEPVNADVLIDALWGESPPRTARAALQNYVAQLRRSLGPGLVESRAGGYVLEVAPEQIDLGRFESLAAEGRDAAGEERVRKLREALELWRGPPLADLVFEPFVAHEAARLEELRTAALEDLIDAQLALGAGSDLVGELEHLIAEHPFRERLRGQLMLALYRSGRQADALEAYQETRRTLVDELGIEPSAPLKELEQAILSQDSSLLVSSPPSTPGIELPPEERRKTVTILFSDLASLEADPELLHDASVRALAQVRAILEDYGATVEQRAGDEVMAVFGIPHAHEDDALRAARAALELQNEIADLDGALRDEGRGGIELRVGIESGEVLAGADDAGFGFTAGPAITLAKRTLQRAGPGEILAGPATLRLIGSAVVTVPVEGSPSDTVRIVELIDGVPEATRQLDAPLVGRGAELAAVHDAFIRVSEEQKCRLFLILGEAGIGKTRLSNELVSDLEGVATVLVGRCVSYGRGATFVPLAEIVRGAAELRSLSELLAADEHAELILDRLAEIVGTRHDAGSGGEAFWAARRLFESLAAERPLVLVFEDLHWAEPTLLDLLEYLTEHVSNASILLLGLARPELLEARAEWSQYESVHLAPLSSEESEALIENLGEVASWLRREILRTAGGNPLFIEQLFAHALEGGDSESLPPSLDALLVSRLDRLDPGELAVLQRGAVAGAEFSHEGLVQLLPEIEATTPDTHLRALVGKGLIRESGAETGPEGGFSFHHVLIRDAAYGTLPKAQRAELHERFARWLESGPAQSDELVGFHLEQAHRYVVELGAGNGHAAQLAVEAGGHLSAAGLRAAKSGDMPAASTLLKRASTLIGPAEAARSDLLTELGLVLWRSGELEEAEALFNTAIEAALGDRDRRAELRARTELVHLKLRRAEVGAPEQVLALASEAIPVFEQVEDDHALGRIWFAVAVTYGGWRCQYGQASKAAERALDCFERSDWPLVPCLQELAVGLYYGPTPVPEAICRCRALLQKADRGGEAHIVLSQAGLEAMADRFDSARELAALARETYEDLAWKVNIWANYAPIAASVELLAGDFAAAERLLTESCSKLEAWSLRGQLATQGAQLAEALYGQGRYEEALRWSETAEACAASYDAGAQFLWRAVRGKLLARLGDLGEGERLAREAVELASATDSVSQRAHVLLCQAEVLLLQGRSVEAAEAIEQAIRLVNGKGNLAVGRQAQVLLDEVAGG
jgi:DNA-binding SARP family transcriptional activator/class 3 adenylate cyclase